MVTSIFLRRNRASGAGASMGDSMHKREENSVRVTNLSEDTREDDLRVRLLHVSLSLQSLKSTTAAQTPKQAVCWRTVCGNDL